MMRMQTKTATAALSETNRGRDHRRSGSGGAGDGVGDWEMRPGGMLVQKRADSDQNSASAPMIRVRVKFGSICHEVNISSQATFGVLKKMLSGLTGLHHEDQKLLFKDKERDSIAFLDIAGVKDRSKIVLMEDPISQEKRCIEMRKMAKMEKASKSISAISLEVDRLAGRVSALESVMSRGGEVAEKDVLGLTELLMNQLLKLDGIMVDGDVEAQRKMQVRRVQKYVEALDLLKARSTMPKTNGTRAPERRPTPTRQQQPPYPSGSGSSPSQSQQPLRPAGPVLHRARAQQDQPQRHSASGPVVITTQWEAFDVGPSAAPAPSPASRVDLNGDPGSPQFHWDLL